MRWSVSFVYDEGKLFPWDADGAIRMDNSIPLLNMWRAMERLVETGLIKRIGVSSRTINALERLRCAEGVRVHPYTDQVEFHLYLQQPAFHLYLQQPAFVQYLQGRGIVMTWYSPLPIPARRAIREIGALPTRRAVQIEAAARNKPYLPSVSAWHTRPNAAPHGVVHRCDRGQVHRREGGPARLCLEHPVLPCAGHPPIDETAR